MKKVLLKYCGSHRPVLLFVDGHASHINLSVIDLPRENEVIIFCLPPHTTHALQLLDVSVFKSLKSHFSKEVHALSFAKKDFVARVVKTLFERAFSMSNIKAGYAKCGIHPFDPNAIDQSKLLPSLQSFNSSADDSATLYPSSMDTSSGNLTIPSLDDSEIPSGNRLPFSSRVILIFSQR